MQDLWRIEEMSILSELFEDMKNAYLNPPTLCEDKQKIVEEIDWMDWEIAKLEAQKLELIEEMEKRIRKEDSDGSRIYLPI